MKIFGLVGSYRKLGNTEVLVKEALMEARRLGADVDFLRLTDLRIEPCKGCMACAFKGEDCRIVDDWQIFRDRLIQSDAVILGAPTYILGASGIIKMITDRNIALQTSGSLRAGRIGAVLGVSGVKGWEQFTLPMLSIFMFSCGVRVIDQAMFYGQGPGEILLKESAMQRAKEIGSNVFNAVSDTGKAEAYFGEKGVCPVCHQNLFSIEADGLVCALCQAKAALTKSDGQTELVFNQETTGNHRWSEQSLIENFAVAILPSGPRFLEKRSEIAEKAQRYKGFPTSRGLRKRGSD